MSNRSLYNSVNEVLYNNGIRDLTIYELEPIELLSIIREKIDEYSKELNNNKSRYSDVKTNIDQLKEKYKDILFKYQPKPIKNILSNFIQNIDVDVVNGKVKDITIKIKDIDSYINLVDVCIIFNLSSSIDKVEDGKYKIKEFHVDKVTENEVSAKIKVTLKEIVKKPID